MLTLLVGLVAQGSAEQNVPAVESVLAAERGLRARGLASSTDDGSGDDADDLFDDDDALVTDTCTDFLDEVRARAGKRWGKGSKAKWAGRVAS